LTHRRYAWPSASPKEACRTIGTGDWSLIRTSEENAFTRKRISGKYWKKASLKKEGNNGGNHYKRFGGVQGTDRMDEKDRKIGGGGDGKDTSRHRGRTLPAGGRRVRNAAHLKKDPADAA